MTALTSRATLVRYLVLIVPLVVAIMALGPGCAPNAAPTEGLGLEAWLTDDVVAEVAGVTAAAEAEAVEAANDPSLARLEVSATSLDFGAEDSSRSFRVERQGTGSLAFEVTTETPWLAVEPAAGVVGDEDATVQVYVDRASLTPGVYTGALTVGASDQAAEVEVRLVVSAAPAGRDGESVLRVGAGELDFGEADTALAFEVCNDGDGVLSYTVELSVEWAAVSPSFGDSAGECDPIDVQVSREGLAAGAYEGQVRVVGDNGESEDVLLRMQVSDDAPAPPAPEPEDPPAMALSATALDFGAEGWVRGFTVSNPGGGTLTYSIAASVDWLVVEPATGAVTDEAAVIEVQIDRNPLVVGAHAAQLTVHTNAGVPVTVTVEAEKPLTSPLIIPWVELPMPDDDSIAHLAEGLQAWRRVTDTAVVTTSPGREWLFGELMTQVPEMTIIPSLKTAYRLGEYSFDSLSGWQKIANAVEAAVAVTGVPVVLLENETALVKYWHDEADIDLEQLRECLRLLPEDIQYIWYPTNVAWSPEVQAKWAALAQVVEEELDCRFVDASFAYRWWYEGVPEWAESREILEGFAEEPTMPSICFGCFGDTCFWDYDETWEIMGILEGRPDTLFYPGYTRWIESAEAIANELWLDAGGAP